MILIAAMKKSSTEYRMKFINMFKQLRNKELKIFEATFGISAKISKDFSETNCIYLIT